MMQTADTTIVLAPRELTPPSGTAAIAAEGEPFESLLRPVLPENSAEEDVALDEAAETAAIAFAAQQLPLELPQQIVEIDAEAPLTVADVAVAESGDQGESMTERTDGTVPTVPAIDLAYVPVAAVAAKPPIPGIGEVPAVAAGMEPPQDFASDMASETPAASADSARQPEQALIPADVTEPAASPSAPVVTAAPSASAGQPSPPTSATHEQTGLQGATPAHIDSPRLLARVARAFHRAQQRGGELTLRLSPPELGSLRVELHLEEGAMTARLEAETEVARAALIEHLPVLRERLAEQGVRVERFDVDLMQQGPGQEPGARNQEPAWERGREGEGERGRIPKPRVEQALPLTPSPALPLPTTSGLNVVI